MEKAIRSIFTSLDLLTWRDTSCLVLTPKFQRRGVWKTPARSYFIDTLIRQMPVPPMFIRTAQNEDRTRTVREVIDGQQRIRAVLDYLDGKYSLSRTLDAPYRGKAFDGLTTEEQDAIRAYPFSFECFTGISDTEILEVFQRLNTYSVQLNAQELRNGTFFGLFKQLAYLLAHEHLEFWRRHGIASETVVARMGEVEMTSELIILMMAGLQDKKKSVNTFYRQYDQDFPDRDVYARHFRAVIDTIESSVGDDLHDTEFHRIPLFYTLFAAVSHYLYGVPGQHQSTPQTGFRREQRESLRSAIAELSAVIEQARDTKTSAADQSRFVAACLRQTDNIAPRQERFVTLYKEAFLH